MWLMYLVCAGVSAWVILDVWTKVCAERKSRSSRMESKDRRPSVPLPIAISGSLTAYLDGAADLQARTPASRQTNPLTC
jgi:hypothetical protein